jgi:hypothetical protein
MKITATFIHGRPRFAGVLAATLWTVAAAFAVAAGWLALSVAELHAEHPQLVARHPVHGWRKPPAAPSERW